jgi:hypothetical protein
VTDIKAQPWYHHLGAAERAEVERMAAEIERLRAILRDLQPDIKRLELCEASAEDNNTPRLQMLRRALEPKP